MDKLAQKYQEREALNFGMDSLKNRSDPNDFNDDLNMMISNARNKAATPQDADLAEQNIRDAVQTGMRYHLNDTTGNNKVDWRSLQTKLQGDVLDNNGSPVGGNNAQKIEQVFGPQARQGLENSLNQEQTWANTSQKLRNISTKTREQNSAENLGKSINPTNKPLIENPGELTAFGSVLSPATKAVNDLATALRSPATPQKFLPLAKTLTAQGPEYQKVMSQVLRAAPKAAGAKLFNNQMRDNIGLSSGVGTLSPLIYMLNNKVPNTPPNSDWNK